MHMLLCHGPVDKITQINVDGKRAWSGGHGGGRLHISASNLFGGEKREGGVSGSVDILMGHPNQPKNDYLKARLGSKIPAFRGVVSAILRQVYIGMNPYLKRWAFRVQRIHVRDDGRPQWYNDKAEIGSGDMNPAHIIRECLTSLDWGMGYTDEDIDDNSFIHAANQLHAEGFGLSLLWDKETTIDKFIELILKHIDGALFVDRKTGRFTLKLIRDDYDKSSLIKLGPHNVGKINDFTRPTVGELTNSVTVQYWDRSTGKNATVSAQDIALAQQQGCVISTTQKYPGITNGGLASRVASRDLRGYANPLIGCVLIANREAASLNVGDVFLFEWPQYGVSETVMRVTNISLGTLTDNKVKIECVQDVFALSEAIYASPTPTGWALPLSEPAPCPYRLLVEAPYYEVVQRVGMDEAAKLAKEDGFLIVAGTKPAEDALNADLHVNSGGGYELVESLEFTPTALLMADAGYMDTSLSIGQTVDIDIVEIGSHIQINDELMQVTAISDTEIKVNRGVADTIPHKHPSGSRVFAWDYYGETDGVNYQTGEIVHAKITPATGRGILDLGVAPQDSVRFNSRASRPYPPGNFKINNQYYPKLVTGALVLSWAHRDRVQQADHLKGFTFGDVGPESGTTYKLKIWDENNNLVVNESELTGNTYNYTDEKKHLGQKVTNPTNIFEYAIEGEHTPSDGYLLINVGVRRRERDPHLNILNTDDPDWDTNYGQTKDIGVFHYVYDPATATSIIEQPEIIPVFDLSWELYIFCWNRSSGNDVAEIDLELQNKTGQTIAAIRVKKEGSYKNGLWYGSSLNDLTKAKQEGSYPGTKGVFSFEADRLIFQHNLDDPNRNLAFEFQCDMSSVAQIKASNMKTVTGYDYAGTYIKIIGGGTGSFMRQRRLNHKLRISLSSQRDELQSNQSYDVTVDRDGYGYQYGKYYGGH